MLYLDEVNQSSQPAADTVAVCTRTLTGHTNSARVVAFHPADADLLASGSDDRHIKVWKISTGGNVLFIVVRVIDCSSS